MRAVARRARRAMVSQDVEPALKTLLGEFLLAVSRFEPVLRLLIVQWLNPNPEYRRLIRRELSMMRREMANDMRDAAQLKGMGEVGFDVESDAIFSLLITFVLNALDISLEKREQRLAILERQVMMVVLGSRALRA